jgi:AcrR family transcriptional regulator
MRPATDHRPAILKTAARLFAQKRYDEVRMEDVAGAVGIAKGTIYRFYPDKEQLYSAICLASFDELNGQLKALAGGRQSARERLTGMVLCVAEHFHANRDNFRVMQQSGGLLVRNRAAFLSRRSASRGYIAKVIRGGQADGEFRNVEPKAAGDMLLGMIRSMFLFYDPRLTPRELSERILDVFLHGLAPARSRDNGRRA